MYRPDSENGFSAQEREAYNAQREPETIRALHFEECCAIIEERRQHGFTLDERDSVSDYLAAAMPLPLPSDSEFIERLAKAIRIETTRVARPRNLRRTELRHDSEDSAESLADEAQSGE